MRCRIMALLGLPLLVWTVARPLHAQTVSREIGTFQVGDALILIRGNSERYVEVSAADDGVPIVGAFDPDSLTALLDSAAQLVRLPERKSAREETNYESGFVFGRYLSSISISRSVGGRAPGLYLYLSQRPFSTIIPLSQTQYRRIDKALREAARTAANLWFDAHPAGTPTRPFRADQVDTPAVAITSSVQPDFSTCAFMASDTGAIQVRLLVDTAGVPDVYESKLLSGPVLCEFAVREALEQWRFRPALRRGRPVFQQMILSFRIPAHRPEFREQR